MPQEWGSYFCNVNDKLASVALDLSLDREAPMPGKPWLLWVWVYLRFPKPNGLSDNAEFEVICAIEDALTKHLADACRAIEAGRITTEGRREFYFYGARNDVFQAAVTEALQQFGQHKFNLGSEQDREWNQYRNVLYPSDEDFQRMKNQDVLEVLMNHGDILTAIRDVHHWIYFRSRDDRERFASEARELGYTIERESENVPGKDPFGLQITRNQSVTPDQIDDAVIELFRLAQQVDADYDGWEAQVIAAKN